MKKQKKYLWILAAFFVLGTLQKIGAQTFTPAENQFIEKLFDFRLSLRACPSPEDCIEKILLFEKQQEKTIETFSQEAALTCRNMLVTARYNCEYEKDMHSPNMEGILRPQYEKITEYSKEKTVSDLNPLFVLTSADLTNSMMQFLPRSSSITLGLQEKKDYAQVVQKNPKMSFALTLSGWWYYYAPAVGGGSVSKAGEFFKEAQQCALSAYDRYYANINLAQFYFEQKDKEKCRLYMEEAEKVLPNTRYTALIKRINSLGYSLFDYNMNSRREKIDRKLLEGTSKNFSF